ncbi:MAG: hypothetical protein RJA70_2199 [Pseudomonadota bacterium]|jgi:hypothetical protein
MPPAKPPQVEAPVLVSSPVPPQVNFEFEKAQFVDLELTVNEVGEVTLASVLTSSAAALEDAARTWAEQLQFKPATRAGEPVAVVIEYRCWFPVSTAPVATEPEPALAEPAPAAVSEPVSEPAPALTEPAPEEEYTATAEVDAPPRETTRRTLGKAVLAKVPGTRGDAIRAIEVLPGVARAPQGQNPLIRGGAQFDSVALLDGTPLPFLYHFGGVTSVIPSRLLERVDLYPGNFSARYGRVTSGVVEARLRDPASDSLHGVVDLSLLDSAALVEAPLSETVSLALGARRSNIDFVFENFVPEGAFEVLAAPLYWDYQAVASLRLAPKHSLRLAAFGARDEIQLLFADPSQEDPNLRGDIELALAFHKLQLRYQGEVGQLRQSLTLALGKQDQNQVLGPETRAFFDIYELDVQAEWELPIAPSFDAIWGLDLSHQTIIGAYRGSVAATQEGSFQYSDKNRGRLTVDETTIPRTMPAVFAEARLRPVQGLLIVPGIRVDYYHQLDALTFNPRVSARYALTTATTLKAGVGGYSQPPLFYESFAPVGNPALDPYHAIHTSAGVEQALDDTLSVDVEGFYKALYNRVVGTAGSEAPYFRNGGIGRIYGSELGLTWTPTESTFGQLSYTLSRSERREPGRKWRLFDQDQPHIINVAAGHSWDSGWELGVRFRYVSGNPNTPVQRAVYDATRDVYVPIFADLNSDRDAAFHQLDVRGEKRFKVGDGELAVYLDVQNVYNQENPEGYAYSYDYSKRETISGLPFFPNLGLRGTL